MRRDPFQEWADINVERNDPNQRIYPRSPPMAQLKLEESMPPNMQEIYAEAKIAHENMTFPLFEVGDLVQLRSGGPKMTIFQHQHDGLEHLYKVSWFVGDDLKRDCFGERELVLKLRAPKTTKEARRAKPKNSRRRPR